MKQVLIRQGKVMVEEVPAPKAEPGFALVQVSHSCISAGTELSGMKGSATPLWKKALKQPTKVKKAFQMMATQGFSKTKSVIQGKLVAGDPTGYSAAGMVLEKGKVLEGFSVGDRVACAGAQYANHAEIILVPKNLIVHVPKKLDLEEASTVTLGAIALQGVRRANPTLGETFGVIGLGLLGQLTVQMLKANGCRVLGLDLDQSRVALAKSLGMDHAVDSTENPIEEVLRLTDGIGLDGVLITAATASSEVVSTAFQLCRKKGRVVLVGDVGLNLNRADFYPKELDFFISTSYGPGRYDGRYEEKGLDYPISYVRWTENRNMAQYLRLLAEKKIRIKPLIQGIYPVDKAAQAYQSLSTGSPRPLIVLLSYPQAGKKTLVTRVVPNPLAQPSSKKKIRLALVGAGGFAKGMHLPNLQALSSHYHLRAVVSRSGANANATARQFGADYASTDFGEVLKDKETDAVLIATRHHLHGDMALAALKAGKHVLVEKPLALNEKELGEIEKFYEKVGSKSGPVLLTGFNRRFSKYARAIQEVVQKRTNPMILNYRMNAGYIPLDHWVHGEEGGGRNIGEACHIYDLFTFLTGSKVTQVEAQALKPA
ncbi:MAG TPA: bi-domain-containing oxidoreductase, partial [bacterium]